MARVELLGGALVESVFDGCDALEELYIGPGVTKISYGVFTDFDSLRRVVVDSAAEVSFQSCGGLETAEIKSPVVGRFAFSYCTNLTSAVLGEGVGEIGDYAFDECRRLEEIVIPTSVTYIGDSAFYGCSGLTSVTIPEGVKNIGASTFRRCSGPLLFG